jgi:serine/threonine protein kinase
MGIVFHAEDQHLRRRVALKVMSPGLALSEEGRQRFLREARTAAALEHDHIVPVYQAGEDQGVLFLAMPLLRGESLETRLRRERLPLAEVLRIGRELALGLAAAHAQGVIHRDIKPANIWLEAETGRVKILDFGLARAVSEANPSAGGSQPFKSRSGSAVAGITASTGVEPVLTQAGGVLGTPAYMAPEQALGLPVDARCDLFSLGCVLYQMITGEPPFRGAGAESVLLAVVSKSPRPLPEYRPDLPPPLLALVASLLAKDPAERLASAQATIERLKAAEEDKLPPGTGKPRRSPKRFLAWIFVLLVLAGLVLARFLFWGGPRPLPRVGDLASAHQPLAGDCAACHQEAKPSINSKPVTVDQKCQQCHYEGDLATHHSSQKAEMTPSCGTCHSDHHGRDHNLTRVADQDCTSCHEDLKDSMKEGSPHYDTKVTSFADQHPEFRDLKNGNPGKLKFNHKYHMTPGIVLTEGGKPFTLANIPEGAQRERYRQPGQKDTDAVRLGCASCHTPEARDEIEKGDRPNPVEDRVGWEKSVQASFRTKLERRGTTGHSLLPPPKPGAYMAPIVYENHCASCHQLFSVRGIVPAPHGVQPAQLKKFFTRVYQEVGTNPKSLDSPPASFMPLPGKRPGAWTGGPVQEPVEVTMRLLLEGKRACGACHLAKDGGRVNLHTIEIARPAIPEIWLTHARFDHRAHAARGIGCKDCHPAAYATRERDLLADNSRKGAEVVLIEGIQNCRQCHASTPIPKFAERGLQARHGCSECHSYHHGREGR